jgi:hypothetical protein
MNLVHSALILKLTFNSFPAAASLLPYLPKSVTFLNQPKGGLTSKSFL